MATNDDIDLFDVESGTLLSRALTPRVDLYCTGTLLENLSTIVRGQRLRRVAEAGPTGPFRQSAIFESRLNEDISANKSSDTANCER